MIDNSFIVNTIEELIWIFFYLSIILLILFLVVKFYIESSIKRYKIFLNFKSIKKRKDYIQYGKMVALKLLFSKNKIQKIRVLKEILDSNIYSILEDIYNTRVSYFQKMHIFSILSLLSNKKVENLSYEIINSKRLNINIPEFIIIPLLGLSTNIENGKDLYRFYEYLSELDRSKYFTHNFTEFLFVSAFENLTTKDLENFIDKYKILSSKSEVVYGFIYALYSKEPSRELYQKITSEYSILYANDYRMVRIIYDLGEYWGIDSKLISGYCNRFKITKDSTNLDTKSAVLVA